MKIEISFQSNSVLSTLDEKGIFKTTASITSLQDCVNIFKVLAKALGSEHVESLLDDLDEKECPIFVDVEKPQASVLPKLEELILPPYMIVETKIPDTAYSVYRQAIRDNLQPGIGESSDLGWFILKNINDTPKLYWSEKTKYSGF